MALFGCECKRNCPLAASIVSAIVGVLVAFAQITGAITVTAVFLVVALGIAIANLGLQVLAAALARRTERDLCPCTTVRLLLAGILGTIALAVLLLAVGIVATSLLNALLVGLLAFFFALMVTATACYVRCLTGCGE